MANQQNPKVLAHPRSVNHGTQVFLKASFNARKAATIRPLRLAIGGNRNTLFSSKTDIGPSLRPDLDHCGLIAVTDVHDDAPRLPVGKDIGRLRNRLLAHVGYLPTIIPFAGKGDHSARTHRCRNQQHQDPGRQLVQARRPLIPIWPRPPPEPLPFVPRSPAFFNPKDTPMKSHPNIAREMSELARERGIGLTREELRREGFSDSQIDAHAPEAARLLRAGETRRAA